MNEQQAKSLFFAQYYNCKCWVTRYTPREFFVWEMLPEIQDDIADYEGKNLDKYVLLLKTVNQLTDEEIKNIADMYGWVNERVTKDRYDERLLQFKIDLPCIVIPGYKHRHEIFVFDYLRSIGILLPFTYIDETGKPVTLSVEETIAKGWAKIATVAP